ncbi:MAG TPA: aminodeoxychorismate synthase component I [Humidesulfovibrio sp.]|uniref:aminodeoxychorismate synthase component I n=1 Tax=Humidesulfovibrio sp. TaxID=2910988 RepID=UPI002BADA723|nr:aminodeoxychorismate synthase component I [Humidesulfovibrio sp.]HWR02642.1 aminodeoxychorismate synthase component I [Humidesulfovibrio sp.]
MVVSARFLDASPDGSGWGRSLAFGEASETRQAWSMGEVAAVVAWAEAQARAGRWVVLALAFEAAPAFDDALAAHAPQLGLPLAFTASHAAPLPELPLPESSEPAPSQCSAPGPWRALVPPADYARRFARLHEWLAEGETYQANYTIPFECDFNADAEAWFARLAREQSAGFCAFLDLGRHRALSFSPELFFRLDGQGGVLARPMKGTAARGAAPQDDRARRAELAACPKNRAENVMIVDLLRSDLGRVAKAGSVRVPRLFHVEAYPTVYQMTSDVRAELRPGVSLLETLAALFPCGSVTGAPKVRTMRLIQELEPHPRGLYCGAIGLLEPSSGAALRAAFSVPIRTVCLDTDTALARFGVGGGVTFDSTLASEYAEIQAKMRFLIPPEEDFELLESMLLLNGRLPLLDGHLDRLGRSAEHFGFPADGVAVLQALEQLARNNPEGRHKVRLLLARDGGLRAEAAPIARGRMRVRLGFAPAPVNAPLGVSGELLAHKTTRRAVYEAALAACPGCDDALLVNERGEVTESTRASLVLELDGELVTPPLSSGLLPGVFRQCLLERGIVCERVILPADVLRARRVWLVNAVRWWMRCELAPVAGTPGG